MTKIFGIPVGGLAAVLVALLGFALCIVGALAVRNRIFLRLGIRNVGRRRARSALIVTGLMLGTAIIAAALATGDTMSSTPNASPIESTTAKLKTLVRANSRNVIDGLNFRSGALASRAPVV